MEFVGPQAKPWLIRLPTFEIGVRPGPYRLTLRDEVMAALPELALNVESLG